MTASDWQDVFEIDANHVTRRIQQIADVSEQHWLIDFQAEVNTPCHRGFYLLLRR
jgi:hypothetical protein